MAVHGFDFLAEPPAQVPGVVVLAGGEGFLTRQCLLTLRKLILGADEEDFGQSVFDGRQATITDVLDELATPALFGSSRRLVVVDQADDFVSNHRSRLEQYAAHPKKASVLVLLVGSFPRTTRLAKQVEKTGLSVDCGPPQPAKLPKWLARWCQQAHGKKLAPDATAALLELVGPELGLLDQELAKLASLAGDKDRITETMVTEVVTGGRVRSTWDMIDAALAGDAAGALAQLDRLLTSGEQPVPLLAAMSSTLRRFAQAAWLIVQAQQMGRRKPLRQALQDAKVPSFVLSKGEEQLRHLGRERALQLFDLLVQADLGIKGDSPLPPRVILERLIVQLAAKPSEAPPAGAAAQ